MCEPDIAPEPTDVETNDAISINTPERHVRTSFCTQLKQPVFRGKVLHTLWLFGSFVMLGFIVGQRGPSFLDLLIITNTDLKRGSAFFTGQAVGYLVGSFLMGVLYDKLTKTLVMFLSIFFMGLSVGVIPFCSHYVLMIAICFFNAIFLGAVDTGGNAELFRVWGSEGRQYMLAIHFAFSFGGTISPIVTEPFLAPRQHNVSNSENTTIIHQTLDPDASSLNAYNNNSHTLEAFNNSSEEDITKNISVEDTNIYVAYLIGSFFTVASSIPFLVMFFKDRTRTKKRELGEQERKHDSHVSKPLFGVTILLLCLFYIVYSSTEDTFASFLLTFTVRGLDWTKSHGSQVTSAYWGAFAIARFLGIFVPHCLTSVKLLFLCTSCLALCLVGFLLSAHFNFSLGIWLFAVPVGLSMSVIFPTAFTWAEEELFTVTGKVSAAILCASSAGTMVNPILLSYLMQQYTPMWFCYLLLTDSVVCTGTFLVLVFLSIKFIKRKSHPNPKQQYSVEITPL